MPFITKLTRIQLVVPSKGMVVAIITGVWVLLLLASIAQDVALAVSGDQLDKIWRLDVDVELSFYTWFSALLLGFAALILGLIALEKIALKDPLRFHWAVLAVIFLFLSADEAVSLHEWLSGQLTKRLGTAGYLYFAWIIPAFVLCVAGLALYIPFIAAFPPRLRFLLVLSALLFLSGAMGMEVFAGSLVSASKTNLFAPEYRIIATLEEALEGAGIILFLYTLLTYWQGERNVRMPV